MFNGGEIKSQIRPSAVRDGMDHCLSAIAIRKGYLMADDGVSSLASCPCTEFVYHYEPPLSVVGFKDKTLDGLPDLIYATAVSIIFVYFPLFSTFTWILIKQGYTNFETKLS